MATLAFSTLQERLMVEGSALFNVLRHFGSVVFISLSILVLVYGTLHARYAMHSALEDTVNDQFDNYYAWKNSAWIIAQVAVLSLAFLFFFHFYPNAHVHKSDYFDVTKLLIFNVVLCLGSGLLYVVRRQHPRLNALFTVALNLALLCMLWMFWQLYTY